MGFWGYACVAGALFIACVGCQKQAPMDIVAESVSYSLEHRDFAVSDHLQLFHLRKYAFSIPLQYSIRTESGAEADAVAWTRARPEDRYAIEIALTDSESQCMALSKSNGVVDTNARLHFPVLIATEFHEQLLLEGSLKLVMKIGPLVVQAPFIGTTREGEQRTLQLQATSRFPKTCEELATRQGHRAFDDKTDKDVHAITRSRVYEKTARQMLEEHFAKSGPVYSETSSHARTDIQWRTAICDSLQSLDKKACLQRPNPFFEIEKLILVDAVASVENAQARGSVRQIRQTASVGRELNETQRYAKGVRETEQFLRAYASKLGFERFGNGFQFTTAYSEQKDLFKVYEFAAADEQRVGARIDDYTLLTSEELTVPLTVSAQNCIVVHPHAAISESIGTRFWCGPLQEMKTQESWYEVRDRQHPTSSAHLDPVDSRLRGWAKLMRGESSYRRFKQVMEDQTRSFRFEKMGDSFVSDFSMQETESMFPGVLSSEIPERPIWSLKQRQNSIQHCAQSAVGGDLQQNGQSERAVVACGCLYDVIGRQWSFEEFTADWKRKLSEIASDGWNARCATIARKSVR